MQRLRSTALQADINVTPLVDVCLVLLIIFMVVTPMIVNGIPVHLPAVRNAVSAGEASRQLPISVNADGTLYVDAIVIRSEQLADVLRARHEQFPDRPVAVRGDKSVKYGAVMNVLSACRAAGFHDVSLIAEKSRE
jgi:biopolymer transport protein TolR